MEEKRIINLADFEGIEVNNRNLGLISGALNSTANAIVKLADVQTELLGITSISVLRSTALLSVNSMMDASQARCTRDTPPEPIGMTTNATGDLILRCEHSPPHEWRLDGTQI